jgi:hypothetical protein
MKKLLKLAAILFIIYSCSRTSDKEPYLKSDLGYWQTDEAGLPAFTYTGFLPYSAKHRGGEEVYLDKDPRFILGNYKFIMYPTVSGKYQLLATQRGLGRMNQGDEAVSGDNGAYIVLPGNDSLQLTGMESPVLNQTKRTFGVGYARYSYPLQDKNISLTRTLAVEPSTGPREGKPAFLLTVDVENTGNEKVGFSYGEYVRANYQDIRVIYHVDYENRDTLITYSPHIEKNKEENKIRSKFTPVLHSNTYWWRNVIKALDTTGISENTPFPYEIYPPSLFLKSSDNEITPDLSVFQKSGKQNLLASYEIELQPGEKKQLKLVIGMSFDHSFDEVNEMANPLLNHDAKTFSNAWNKVIPAFEEADTSEVYQQELKWHAYNMEAIAMYNRFYNETKVPQNCAYTTYMGKHILTRDHFQHMLPLIYYNQPTAKSSLRYLMRRITPTGRIVTGEHGVGSMSGTGGKDPSDHQLFCFWSMAEYLRITGDYSFLKEQLLYYSPDQDKQGTVLQHIEKAADFLIDSVGLGEHGIINLRNYDWNDGSIHAFKSYNAHHNEVAKYAESYLNAAMASSVIHILAEQLQQATEMKGVGFDENRIKILRERLMDFRQSQYQIVKQHLRKRGWLPRFQLHDIIIGDSNLFLSPQGFVLMNPDLDIDLKRQLVGEVKSRLEKGEVLGPRNLEKPTVKISEVRPHGSGVFGGHWYALTGPYIIGAMSVDTDYARELIYKMSFANQTKHFPQYWLGQWTQYPNIESTLQSNRQGLPPKGWIIPKFPGFSGHPHSWMLFCHYKLNEELKNH